MSGPRNTEPQANYELARALRRRNPDWTDRTVHAERTNVIQQAVPGSGAAKKPDILVAPPRRQPVIVETEFGPARTVEQDATARLGTSLQSTGADIEGVLSVVLPEGLRAGDLETIEGAAFRYATHYLNSDGEGTRWPPKREWLEGSVDDLADAIEYLLLSERQLARGTEALEQVVRNAAALLAEHAGDGPLSRIAEDLHQEPGVQTERMAAAICLSAFVFHVAIEGQDAIPPVPLAGSINKATLLDTWNEILAVNYWPIFSIARDVVRDLPVRAEPHRGVHFRPRATGCDNLSRPHRADVSDPHRGSEVPSDFLHIARICLPARGTGGRAAGRGLVGPERDRRAADCGLRLRHGSLAFRGAACRVPALPPGRRR